MKNLEIKIPVESLTPYAERAMRAGARFEGTLRQVDTFFGAARGMLKLRVIDTQHPTGADARTAELIAYERPIMEGSRVSDYSIFPVTDANLLLEILSRSLERGVQVRKSRDLWMYGGTRIHLDTVEGLGVFIELETQGNTRPDAATQAEHDEVIAFLELDVTRAIAGSYAGMLEEAGAR